MKKFIFENQGTNTFLTYDILPDDVIDTMSLGMLTNNKIPGLAPAIFTQMDNSKYIKYNVSAHISVSQFFSGPVNKKRLIGVFKGIVDAMLSAEEYMIDINSIIMDFDYIFADVSTCETFLICLPINSGEMSQLDLGAFFKNIMFKTQFDQTENCDHVAKIMNYLNSAPVFSLYDFKELLMSIDSNVAVQSASVQPPVQPKVTTSQMPVQPAQPVIQPISVQSTSAQPSVQPQPSFAQSKPVAPPMPTPVQPPKQPIAVPGASPSASTFVQPPDNQGGKKMSMFDLLRNYSKENAELYKKQKEAEKASGNVKVAQPVKEPKLNKKKEDKNAPAFTVPGQAAAQSNTSFAIPGQAPAPVNANFAVPGQVAAPVTQTQPQVKSQSIPQPSPQPASQSVSQVPIPPVQQVVSPAFQSANFGETTVLGGGAIGETTVLGAAPTAAQPKPHLIRTKNNEKINLDKPVFRIGKERSYVDYFIGDNPAISRSHANIINRDGKCFIVDTNSKNHTYVNSNMLQSNDEVALNHGDKVRLANEDFEFRLY